MIEKNKIYCGDNLELIKQLDDNCIDLTVTSPPYDNLRTYNGYSWDFDGLAQELFRVTKDGGVVVWVVGDATINGSETGTSFRQALTAKMALKNQRNFIGFELSQEYCDIAEKRIEPWKEQTRLF